MVINKTYFDTLPDGRAVDLYTLTNAAGVRVGILSYGGIVAFWQVPDGSGKLVDVMLGFDSSAAYEARGTYFGALVGRCANRIGGASFTLGGQQYALAANSGRNHLHGGPTGFHNQIWDAEIRGDQLVLSLTSPDGHEGYPGTMRVSVTHTLSDDGTLRWDYSAAADRDTLCNLTNHAYFNLSGHDSGSILGHQMQIHADAFTATDEELIPTGELIPVEGTPMDFKNPTVIGARIEQDYAPLRLAGGYDHNYCLTGRTGVMREAARAYSPDTGLSLMLSTTLPGVQLYTGNFLDGKPGKSSAVYGKNSGFCLETQMFPDAIHHGNFESAVLPAGEKWSHSTSVKIGIL